MPRKTHSWTELEREELIKGFHSSGMTQQAYSHSRGISLFSLRKLLNLPTPPRAKFIELPPAALHPTLEVRFSDGTIVRLG